MMSVTEFFQYLFRYEPTTQLATQLACVCDVRAARERVAVAQCA